MSFHRLSLLFVVVFLVGVQARVEAQQSLHEQPVGTTVEGGFSLAGKYIPLPEGKFKLAHAGVRAATLLPGARIRSAAGDKAEVVLYKSEAENLQVVLHATANFGTKSRWSIEPCKRNDLLYRLDRAETFDWKAECFTVNHQLGLLTNPGGIWVGVNDRLKQDNVTVPLQLVIVAGFTRMFHEELMEAFFYFNPAYYGYMPDRGPNWAGSPWNKTRIDADPGKAAFVKAIVDWGTQMVPLIGSGFEGKIVSGQGVVAPSMNFPRAQVK